MDWLQQLVELTPLLEIDRCSTVGIDPSDTREEVKLIREVTLLSQESTEVYSINRATVVLVNRSEGSKRREVILNLKFSLQHFQPAGEVDFFLHDRCHGQLNVPWQTVEPPYPPARSVQRDISQDVVLARQEHLDKLLVRKSVGPIAVKELKELQGLALAHMVASVVPQEVNYLVAGDVGRAAAVHSLEG